MVGRGLHAHDLLRAMAPAVEGKGGPGFVRGQAAMELSDVEGGTRVHYSADVQVGGLIASVGQRMLGGVSKLMLDQFFAKMTEILAAQP